MRHAYFRIIMGIVFIAASVIAYFQGQDMALMTTAFGALFLLSGISQYKKATKEGASKK